MYESESTKPRYSTHSFENLEWDIKVVKKKKKKKKRRGGGVEKIENDLVKLALST